MKTLTALALVAAGATTHAATTSKFNVFGEIVNRAGRISPAANGPEAPGSAGTTGPWANFRY